jgi:hypothetical protein
MTKEEYITQYTEIHEELSLIENEIENHISDNNKILSDDSILVNLRTRATTQIDLLNKTRENERNEFNYQSMD